MLKSLFQLKPDPILQSEAAECGLACIAMICVAHGYKTNLSSLRRCFPISLKGSTLKTLIATADKIGFSARPLRTELEGLRTIYSPAILHWDMNHFVVLMKMNRNTVTVHDPARGLVKLKYSEISKHYTGVALELRPSKRFEQKEDIKPVRLSDFWSRISGLKRSLIQAFILSVFLQVFALTTPLYQQMVVDDVITKQDSDFLVVLATGFALLGIINIVISYIRSLVMLHFSNGLNFQMRVNLFRHLLRLPTEFFEKRHIGDISSRFGSLGPVGQLFTNGIIATILDSIMALSTLCLAFYYSVSLTLTVLTFLTIGFIIQWITFPIIKQKNEEIIHLGAKENSNFLETIRAARAIKIYGQETAREGVWQNHSVETLNANIGLAKFGLNLGVFTGIIALGQSILTLYLGANLVIDGAMTIGMLFAYQAYAGQFSGRINSLIAQLIAFRMLKMHLTRLADIVHTEPELVGDVDTTFVSSSHKHIKGNLSLKGISYRYGEHEPFVLKDLNIEINAGEMIAISGASGAGKTTLFKILLGITQPQQGEFRIDGLPFKQIEPSFYRNALGVVMQEDQLLSGTIADNISFFDTNIDMTHVQACAKQVCIDEEIVKSPMGYNSLVGDMGTTLSGGQKQRILLARALYRRPQILLLDEGTANLDIQTESKIAELIKSLPITRIIIAHRPKLIEISDRIFEMKSGSLVELPR